MGINVVGASLRNLLLFIPYCPSETQMRGTVSICYGCLSVKCWARVVTSFPFPSWCMQRYPLNISMDSIDTTEFSLLMFVFEGKWYAPSPTTHTHRLFIIQDPTLILSASPPQVLIHTHGPYSLYRSNHWHLYRKYCLWKNSKQNFLVRVLNTPLTN